MSMPDPGDVPEVVAAMEIWGNPVRARLYDYIRRNPGQFLGQIHAGFRSEAEQLTGKNFSEPNLSRHLKIMREAGVLKIDVPPGPLRGRAPRYEVDPDRSDELIDEVVNFVDGYRNQGRKRP